MKRTVVFDLDGTLADTSGDLLAAANACFRSIGHGDVLGPDDAPVALQGGRAMLRLGFERLERAGDSPEIDRLYPMLLEAYGADIARHTRFFPGAMQAVDDLRRAGHPVAICTNKPEALALKLLQALDLADEFPALVGADTLPVRKPDPEPLFEAARRAGGNPAHCCLIGDSMTDLKTARAAGQPVILVGFGPSAAITAGLDGDVLISDFAELPGAVLGLGAAVARP